VSDLVKLALSPAALATMTRSVKGLGSGAGMGGLVGAGVGAAAGGVRGAAQAREEGGGTLNGGLVGAARGMVRGAALGTAAGGAAGALAPNLAGRLASRGGMLQTASNFGQRQVHSLSGVGDAKYVRSIGGGAADAEQRLQQAREGFKGVKDVAGRGAAQKELQGAQHAFEASERAEGMGLTSIPGYLKALKAQPWDTFKAGVKDQWNSTPTWGKALMYGAPAAGAANELRKEEDAYGEGRGRFERAGRLLGGAASGALAPLALAGDAVAGGLMSAGAGGAGRFVDRSLARLKQRRGGGLPPTEPEPGGGTTQASGYELSDRAAGTAAESVTG
jgi:hypothetical protein